MKARSERPTVNGSLAARPLLIPVLCFVIGIALTPLLPGSARLWAASGLAFLLAGGLLWPAFDRIGPALLAAGFVCAGVQSTLLADAELPANHLKRVAEEALARPIRLEGWVTVPPDPAPAEIRDADEARTRFVMEVTALTLAGQRVATTGQARLTVLGPMPEVGYGDEVRGTFRLRHPRLFDNPGAFQYPAYLASQGVFLEGWTREPIEVTAAGRGSGLLARVFRLRAIMLARIDAAMPPAQASLLKATVLGDRSGLTPEMNQAFLDSGTYHILAISGLNVSILAGTLFGLFRLLRLSPRLAAVLSGCLVTGYAGLAGASASVMRAAVMADVYLLATVLDRRGDLFNTWALSALVLLWWNPWFLIDVGFQLTFLATLGILLIVPGCGRCLPNLPRPLRYLQESIAVTVAATVMTVPILAMNFNRISPIGVLANIPIVPLSGVITATGTAAAAAFALDPSGLTWLNAANGWLVDSLLVVARWFAALPWSTVRVYTPTVPMVLCYYAILALACWALPRTSEHESTGRPRWIRRTAAWSSVILALILCSLVGWRLSTEPSGVRLTVLDVGQGESIFIEAPGGRRMLVDAGGRLGEGFDVGQNVIAPFLLHQWVGRLDALVLTHPESDHIGGAGALLKAFPVGEVWTGGGAAVSASDVWIQEYLRARRIPHRVVATGFSAWEGSIEVLHPRDPRRRSGPGSTKANNLSIVLRVRSGRQGMLLTGDIEREAEEQLTRGASVVADVLKVPHHGSRNSSTESFLAAVRPRAAIVSVGYRNAYRHPHPATLERYESHGVRLFRTDRDGAITVEDERGGIAIRSRRGGSVVLPGDLLDVRGY